MNPDLNPIVGSVIQVILLLILGVMLSQGVKKFFVKVFNLRGAIETENQQIKVTVLRHTISVIQTIIWVVILLVIGALLHMTQIVQLITALGIIFGYVGKDFLMDFIMGVLVLLEQQFRVGDTVTFTAINQLQGKVEEIGVRTTKVRLVETHELYIVSNRLITSVIVHKRRLEKETNKGAQTQHAKK